MLFFCWMRQSRIIVGEDDSIPSFAAATHAFEHDTGGLHWASRNPSSTGKAHDAGRLARLVIRLWLQFNVRESTFGIVWQTDNDLAWQQLGSVKGICAETAASSPKAQPRRDPENQRCALQPGGISMQIRDATKWRDTGSIRAAWWRRRNGWSGRELFNSYHIHGPWSETLLWARVQLQ